MRNGGSFAKRTIKNSHTIHGSPGEAREKSSSDRRGEEDGGRQPEERDAGLPPAELKIHRRVSQFSFERPCMRIPERAY